MQQFNAMYLQMSKVVLVLALFSLLAFYPHYLGVITEPQPWFMHAHFLLMVMWMIILFLQPRFIGRKDFSGHRALGKLSYLLVPLILISSYFMIRFGYYRILTELLDSGKLTSEQAVFKARVDIALGPLSFFVLVICYPLGIAFRKNSQVHATFMIGSALSIVGPILDRVIYQLAAWSHLPNYPYEYGAFLLTDLVLVWLLFNNFQKGLSVTANLVCLVVFVFCHVVYLFFRDTWWWQAFIGWAL